MTLREKIEEAMDNLEIDHEPGMGGWIDSQSKKEAVDAIEIIFRDEIQKQQKQLNESIKREGSY